MNGVVFPFFDGNHLALSNYINKGRPMVGIVRSQKYSDYFVKIKNQRFNVLPTSNSRVCLIILPASENHIFVWYVCVVDKLDGVD